MEIHKTTETLFDRRKEQESRAKKQKKMALEIFRTYSHQWFTREAFQREYEKRTGIKLKDGSASRTLSNLTAVPCKICKELFSQTETRHQACGAHRLVLVAYTHDPIEPPLIKSDSPITMGSEGVMVHAWRFNPKWGGA